MPRLLRCCLCLALVWPALLPAAEEEPSVEEILAAEARAESEAAEADAANGGAAVSEPPVTADGPLAEPPVTGGRASNEAFIPSEQISEDLSVSFPVDI